jgi:hypothetical protein
MSDERQRFPLAWPLNWKRTPPRERRRAPFRSYGNDVSVARAVERLDNELRLLKADEARILSTNIPIGLRGLPLSGEREPADPGVAVYITLNKKPLVFACDKWDRVADNIAAIAQHIDALRRIDRYGVGKLDQAFAGYKALPRSTEDWREVLGVGEYATIDQVDAAFLEKARTAHPDKPGGSHEQMARITAARDMAREVLR